MQQRGVEVLVDGVREQVAGPLEDGWRTSSEERVQQVGGLEQTVHGRGKDWAVAPPIRAVRGGRRSDDVDSAVADLVALGARAVQLPTRAPAPPRSAP